MPKKQFPQPRRSEFDKTDLLERIANLEERVQQLENRGTLIGSNQPCIGSGVRL
jgi:hypothetical protein